MEPDPELARIDELGVLVQQGKAGEPELEELALYAESNAKAAALVRVVSRHQEVGGEWLARTQADNRLAAAEKTPFTLAERSLGVALVGGGAIASFFLPFAGVGTVAILAGAVILGVSVLRVKLKTAGQDPYAKIEK